MNVKSKGQIAESLKPVLPITGILILLVRTIGEHAPALCRGAVVLIPGMEAYNHMGERI